MALVFESIAVFKWLEVVAKPTFPVILGAAKGLSNCKNEFFAELRMTFFRLKMFLP
jgi:hypothetical protein